MKFKINRLQVENLTTKFKGKSAFDFEEIDLEPVWETANEAMAMQAIENKAWHKGYHYGFRDGYHEAKRWDIPRHCFCDDMSCKFR